MLSQGTLRHIEIVHQISNWMRISPVSMNIGKHGIYGNCKVLYKGWKWQLFSWTQITCRILALTFVTLQLLLNTDTSLIEFVLFIGIFTVIVIGINVQITAVSQADNWVTWLNRLFGLNQHLRMFAYYEFQNKYI